MTAPGGQVDQAYIDLELRVDQAERTLRQIENQVNNTTNNAGSSFRRGVGGAIAALPAIAATAAAAIGASLIAAAGASINAFADFESTMSGANAVLGATSGEMEKLSALALKMGADTSFSAGEAAKAIEELGSSGLNATEVLNGGLKGALDLAAATGLKDVAEAARISAGAMNAFGLEASEIPKIADLVASAANASALNVHDFGEAVKNGGAAAKQAGVGIADFTGIVSLMADQMIPGAEAGTAFKAFLDGLTPSGEPAARAMEEIGFSAFDLQGNLKPMPQILRELETGFGKLTQEQAMMHKQTIFGSEGSRVLNTVLSVGTKEVEARTLAVQKMGSADEAARKRLDNLKGDLEKLKGSVESAMIAIGEKLSNNAGLREAVQGVNNFVDAAVPAVVKFAEMAGKGIGDAIRFFKSLQPAVNQTVTDVKNVWAQLAPGIQQGVNLVKSVLTTLTPYVMAVFNGLKPVVQALGPLFTSVFRLVVTVWETQLKPTLDAIGPFFKIAFDFVAATVRSSLQVVTGIFNAISALLRGDVSGAVKAVQNIFNTAGETMGRAMQNAATATLAALSKLVPQMAQVAQNVIAGLVNGIRNGIKAVSEAAGNLAQSAIDNVKRALGIASPSRVMAELGVFTGQGFVNGIGSTNDRVRRAAQNTAETFLAAFRELKLEREVGKVDLSTYTKTLEQSAATLKAKLGTVKEGTPAYTSWLSALAGVTKELDSLRGKSTATQTAAKGMADAIREGREQIAQTEAAEKYARALDNATSKQLAAALAAARAAGDVDKYNAIRAEQKSRDDAAAEAARTAGEAQEAAARKAANALREQAEQLAANRKAIQDGLDFSAWVDGLMNYEDAQLSAARVQAQANGDQARFNAILSEQTRRAEAAAQAISDLVDQQIRLANIRYADTQGASDSAYRQSYGSGMDGLTNAVAGQTGLTADQVNGDMGAALADLERWNSSAATIIKRVWADEIAVYTSNAEEKRAQDEQTQASYDRWYDSLERLAQSDWVAGLKNMTDAQLESALATAEADLNTEDYAAVLAEMRRRTDEAAKSLEAWTDNLSRIGEGNWTKSLGQMSEAALDAALSTAEGERNIARYNAVLAEMQRRTDDATRAQDAWKGNLDKMAFKDWQDGLRGLSDAELAEQLTIAESVKDVEAYNAVLSEQGRRVDEAKKKHDAWVDGLARVARGEWTAGLRLLTDEQLANALATAKAAEKTDDYTALLAEQTRRTDDAQKSLDAWNANLDRIGMQAYVESLKDLSDAELEVAISAARAAKDTDEFNRLLAEQDRRAAAVVDATKLLKDGQEQVAAALGRTELPFTKQIAALTAAKGKSKELDAQIDALIAAMRELQAQAAQQQGLDKLKNTIGQVGDVIQKTFKLFGADESIQQGIGQLTAGIQDGVTAFAKFASGDILGGISAALSGILNIGDAIENLDPGLKAWKKGLLEVAAIEKELVGAKSYGNINNPYYDTLMADAAAREKMGNSKWYQRLGWSIFGGAPQYMSDEAAKFMAESARIFGEVAEAVVSGMDDALMNAFDSGDWTGTEAAMEKNLNALIARMALQAIIAASNLEARIQAYAEARNRAMQDGVIDPAEQAQLDLLVGQIKAEQNRIAQEWRATAETLPGYGAGGKPTDPITPTPLDPQPRNVSVNLPDVGATVNFDVLGTLADVIERNAPRIERGGQAILEGSGQWLAGLDRFDRMLTNMQMRPNGSWKP